MASDEETEALATELVGATYEVSPGMATILLHTGSLDVSKWKALARFVLAREAAVKVALASHSPRLERALAETHDAQREYEAQLRFVGADDEIDSTAAIRGTTP